MVEVTTMLFIRVKSMADRIMWWGQTAAVQQSLCASEGPFHCGLLGPVTVQRVAVAEVDVGACRHCSIPILSICVVVASLYRTDDVCDQPYRSPSILNARPLRSSDVCTHL